MGAVLQTAGIAELAAELTCCACSSVCGLVTRDSATRAKFRYISFLLIATVTCVILLIPGLRVKLEKIPHFCTSFVSSDTCDKLVGFSAVYRLLLAVTAFHLFLSVLTFRVTRVSSFRAKFNNGLWFFKMGLLIGLTVAALYIPRRTAFFRVWMYLSLSGGFMFVIVQIILIIDFGHSWSLSWAERLEAGNTKFWYVAMAFATVLMFSISIAAILCFYMFFTAVPSLNKCRANFFYISFVATQCLAATLVSVAPAVQRELSGAGLLQSSVVVLYTSYLSWNTLSSEPDSTCNPLGHVILAYDKLTGVSGEGVLGALLTLTLLFFACTVRASTSHLGKFGLALAESEAFALETYHDDRLKSQVEKKLETGSTEVALNEYVGYSYSFFHIIMALASSHILMVLTNWHSPDDSLDMQKLVKNWASVWVQMASSFVCVLLYVWFLVTPLVKKVWGPMFGIIVDEQQSLLPPRKEGTLPRTTSANVDTECHEMPRSSNIQETRHASPKPRTNIFASHSRAGYLCEDDDGMARRPGSRCSSRGQNVRQPKSNSGNVLNESLASLRSVASIALGRKQQRRPDWKNRSNNESFADDRQAKNKPCSSQSELTKLPAAAEKDQISEAADSACNDRPLQEGDAPFSASLKRIPSRSALEEQYAKQRRAEEGFQRMMADKAPSLQARLDESTMKAGPNKPENRFNKLKPNSETPNDDVSYNSQDIERGGKRPERSSHSKPTGNFDLSEMKSNNGTIGKDLAANISVASSSNVSTLGQYVQDAETAREILLLQWKILRTQAKVVKIQERVIRLQAEAACANEQIHCRTADADISRTLRVLPAREAG